MLTKKYISQNQIKFKFEMVDKNGEIIEIIETNNYDMFLERLGAFERKNFNRNY